MEDISRIEKKFNSEKARLLHGLEKVEKKKRLRFSTVAKELDRFKRQEGALRKIEASTSAQLRAVNSRIESMKKKDTEDRRQITSLVAEIRRLHREVPSLEKGIRKARPLQGRAAKVEKKYAGKLRKISGKVHLIESRRDRMQHELDAILKKESMLRAGRIYWSQKAKAKVATKLAKKKARRPRKPAKKAKIAPAQKKSFFDDLFKK